VILAMVNLPMVLRVLWLAHRSAGRSIDGSPRSRSRSGSNVSVTGVLVYLCLYVWNPPPAA